MATQLEDGIENPGTDRVAGTIFLSTPKQTYNAGETVEITVKGDSVKAVNALSFALPYDQQDYDFVGIETGKPRYDGKPDIRPPAYQRSKGALS